MKFTVFFAGALFGAVVYADVPSENVVSREPVSALVDWPAFLGRHDMVWEQLPTRWGDAPMLGNGFIGTFCTYEKHTGSLNFEISRTDVYDHRKYGVLGGRPRLPNGFFSLKLNNQVDEAKMRLNLWDAELVGQLDLREGGLNLRAYTHASKDVIVVEIEMKEGQAVPNLIWNPDISRSLVQQLPDGYEPYPPQYQEMVGGVSVSVQEMPESPKYKTDGQGAGQYATAWKIVQAEHNRQIIYISEKMSYPGTTAKQDAVDAVNDAVQSGLAELTASHRKWWHEHYQRSFYSIPDGRLEGFYWLQIYKMGSTSRANSPLVDLSGPWFPMNRKHSPWPALWTNLNIQSAYSPYALLNHLEIGSSLVNNLNRYRKNLNAAAKQAGVEQGISLSRAVDVYFNTDGAGKAEPGNMPYMLYYIWEQYRVTMDKAFLNDKLYWALVESFNFQKLFFEKDEDGTIHFAKSESPEWGGPVRDCSYSLAFLKFLCKALVESNEVLGLNDPVADEAREVLRNLVDYPVDSEVGYRVGADKNLTEFHRHWSHLMMIYPTYEITADSSEEQIELAKRSINHWRDLTFGGEDYSRIDKPWSAFGLAGLKAVFGEGEEARLALVNSVDKIYQLNKNTFLHEWGPVVEMCYYGARALGEISLQSYNNVIRPFPAISDKWRDVAFHNFRAEGGFLVSAKRQDGRTLFVRVTSLAGEALKVKTGMVGEVLAYGNRTFNVTDLGHGVVGVDLKKGESVVLYTGTLPELTIEPVACADGYNDWGLKNEVLGNSTLSGATILNNDFHEITFDGWKRSVSRGQGDYNDDVHYAVKDGSELKFTFSGTGIEYVGACSHDYGEVEIFLDGSSLGLFNTQTPSYKARQVIYSNLNLSDGSHSLRVVKRSGNYVSFDAVILHSN